MFIHVCGQGVTGVNVDDVANPTTLRSFTPMPEVLPVAFQDVGRFVNLRHSLPSSYSAFIYIYMPFHPSSSAIKGTFAFSFECKYIPRSLSQPLESKLIVVRLAFIKKTQLQKQI